MINLKTMDTEEIARYFSYEVNNFLFKPKEIAEEQKNSPDMKDLDAYWIKKISSHDYRTDLRNEQAAVIGKLLATIPFIKKRIESVDNGKMAEVAEIMSYEHKTLQQTFSSLIFYHLQLTCTKKESVMLSDALGDTFYMLPLI